MSVVMYLLIDKLKSQF